MPGRPGRGPTVVVDTGPRDAPAIVLLHSMACRDDVIAVADALGIGRFTATTARGAAGPWSRAR
ncbi:hypothetical protein [Amycolatopsis sp. NPDC051071]|uniref:hypothetical protein n=1 Tax=Amycolatopsis sp. NPDC051071 TaxID=3154637 RepID=UPI0034276EB2